MQIGIFGSSGYIGSTLYTFLVQKGYEVISIGRTKVMNSNHIYFDLNAPDFSKIPKLDAFIICHDNRALKENDFAYQSFFPNFVKNQENINKVLLISTLSAFSSSSSIYGKSKYWEEEFCRSNGIDVAKLGIVIQANNLGSFSRNIAKFLDKLPISTIIGPRYLPIRTTDLDDFCNFIVSEWLPTKSKGSKFYLCACYQPITWQELIRWLHKARISRFCIYIPTFIVKIILFMARIFSIKINFGSDNLNGLLNPIPPSDLSILSIPKTNFRSIKDY